MLLTWDAVLAMSALITVIGAGLAVYVKLMIRAEFETLVGKINGTYVRSSLYNSEQKETERRLVKLER